MTPFKQATKNRQSHGVKQWVGAAGQEQWLASMLLKMLKNQTVGLAAQLNAMELQASCGCVL